MKKKKILICQIVICVVFFGVAFSFERMNLSDNLGIYSKIKSEMSRNVTSEDVVAYGKNILNRAISSTSKAVDVIIRANSSAKYGKPIDEKSKNRILQVHAVEGGMVLESGKNKDLGLFVKIKHRNAVSVYGNLYNINVVVDERVQRGEIIGSYDTEEAKDFYYDLKEKM